MLVYDTEMCHDPSSLPLSLATSLPLSPRPREEGTKGEKEYVHYTEEALIHDTLKKRHLNKQDTLLCSKHPLCIHLQLLTSH